MIPDHINFVKPLINMGVYAVMYCKAMIVWCELRVVGLTAVLYQELDKESHLFLLVVCSLKSKARYNVSFAY